jgi:hypothetical protein
MRLRLLRRRLTVSSPRMAIRSAVPWPVRWLIAAVVLGFSGALALWAFEFGKDIAGLDRNAKQELIQLREEVVRLRTELADARTVANTADSLLTTEKVAQEQLLLQIRQLEQDNQALRSDLGFFERLIPGGGAAGLSIRGVQAERLSDTQLKWQVLLIQAEKNAPEFRGQLEVSVTGQLAGKVWTGVFNGKPQSVSVQRYLRQEGVMDLPPGLVVKSMTAKVLQGAAVRAVQSTRL